jgi:hypothetical protein
MLGQVPKAAKKPACTETFNGQQVSIVNKGCPTPKSKNCTFDSKGNYVCGNGIGNGNGSNGNGNGKGNGNGNGKNPTPTSTCDPNNDPNCSGQNPTPTSTCDPNNNPNCSGQNPTPTSTCQNPNNPSCTGGGGGGLTGNTTNIPTATTAQAGVAVGSGLMILPASLVWTMVSRRQRRKKRAGRAE